MKRLFPILFLELIRFSFGVTVLDLGHTSPIWYVKKSGDKLVTMDYSYAWRLWETGSKKVLLSGKGTAVDFEGNTILSSIGTELKVYDSDTQKKLPPGPDPSSSLDCPWTVNTIGSPPQPDFYFFQNKV